MRTQGSIWKNDSKKKGYSTSRGSYAWKKSGDRHFVLTRLIDGETMVYESHEKAKADGWYISVHAKR